MPAHRKLPPEALSAILAGRRAGKSWETLAADHGVDRRTVRRLAASGGLAPRSRAGALAPDLMPAGAPTGQPAGLGAMGSQPPQSEQTGTGTTVAGVFAGGGERAVLERSLELLYADMQRQIPAPDRARVSSELRATVRRLAELDAVAHGAQASREAMAAAAARVREKLHHLAEMKRSARAQLLMGLGPADRAAVERFLALTGEGPLYPLSPAGDGDDEHEHEHEGAAHVG